MKVEYHKDSLRFRAEITSIMNNTAKVRNEETNETKEFPVDDLVVINVENHEKSISRSENLEREPQKARSENDENHTFAEVRTTKSENHVSTGISSD